MKQNEILTVHEVAKLLGVCDETVRRWSKQGGRLPSPITDRGRGTKLLWRRQEIEKHLGLDASAPRTFDQLLVATVQDEVRKQLEELGLAYKTR